MSERELAMNHGTPWGYRKGCRCDVCKDAKGRSARDYRARKSVGLSAPRGRPAIPLSERLHGVYVTYHKGCRCQPCTSANAEYRKERKALRDLEHWKRTGELER